jgi:hypothetical protein
MIYMIEIDYADPASEPEWSAWYDTYLKQLVTVPGIETAQRLWSDSPGARRHLAIYTLESPAVYESAEYRAVGGGGNASAKWRSHIRRRRNLFDGLARVPEVSADGVLLMTEADPAALDVPDMLFVQLDTADMAAAQKREGSLLAQQVPFDSTPRRFIALARSAAVAAGGLDGRADIAIYRPAGPRAVGARAGTVRETARKVGAQRS